MISVVIPSFNRKESILVLLSDLYRQKGVSFEVLVADDCSSDGSPEAIEQAFPQVRLIRGEKNAGPCVARNRCIRLAQGEIIVGFDSDVSIPNENFLKEVWEAFQSRPEAHGFAFRVLLPETFADDHPRWWHCMPIVPFSEKEFETDYFSGTAYAFRKNELIAAGMFPEILFQYYEEVELSYRILDGGGKIIYLPSLSVVHHVALRTGRSLTRLFYNPRNQILLAASCFPAAYTLTYLPPRLVMSFFRSVLHRNPLRFFKGVFSAVNALPEQMKNRKPLSASTLRYIHRLRDDGRQFANSVI